MPTDHILSLLISERDKLNRAIEALQGTPRRGGRPRKSAMPATDATPTANKKGTTWTPQMRAKARRRAKLAWARRMKQAKKG